MGRIVAVDHHRGQIELGALGHGYGVELIDEGRLQTGLEGLDHLHDQLAPARHGVGVGREIRPGRRGMSATARIAAEVRRAAETGHARGGHGRRIAVRVHLQRGADEHIGRVMARELAEGAIGAQRTVRAGKEHVRPRGDIVLHAQFGAEAMHRLDPAGFDRRDQRRVRVEHPVLRDLAAQAEFFAVGGQQQFDRRGVETDAVVERRDPVFGIDALERHHRHEDLHVGDMTRVTGE